MKGFFVQLNGQRDDTYINIEVRAYLNNRNTERGEVWVLSFGVVTLISGGGG